MFMLQHIAAPAAPAIIAALDAPLPVLFGAQWPRNGRIAAIRRTPMTAKLRQRLRALRRQARGLRRPGQAKRHGDADDQSAAAASAACESAELLLLSEQAGVLLEESAGREPARRAG